MGVRAALLFFFFFFILGDEASAAGRTKRQFSFSFGLPNFGGGDQNQGGGGNDRQNPFGQFLGGLFNQIVRPPPNNNNQGNNNQGNNNQGNTNPGNNNPGTPGVLGNINIGGIPIQVTSQNGGIGVGIAPPNCGSNNGGCEHECRLVRNQIRCFCKIGFFLRQDRRTCEDINECQQGNNGGCSDICNNTPGSFTCSCSRGNLQPDQRTCAGGGGSGQVGIQSCSQCTQLCLHNAFNMRCSCHPGFSLARDGRTCLQLDQCVENNGGCQEICNFVEGNRVCSCGPGKQLLNDKISCRDINECQQGNNGGCSDICNNTPGSFTCSCKQGILQPDQKTCAGGGGSGQGGIQSCSQCTQLCLQNGHLKCSCLPGYSLASDGKTCVQLDQCGENNGGCQEICNFAGGNLVCSCGPGKKLRNDKKRCRDINECRTNNGGCQHTCRNNPGSFKCSCRKGFTLVENGQCQANQQPSTSAPITQTTQKPPSQNEGCGVNLKKSLITRIVGGSRADPKDWPWMAAFLQKSGNTQYCGGTLITDRHVLTAAHCMKPFSAQNIFVRLGEYDFSTTNDNSPLNFNVADIKMHERYNSNTQENDIALVSLDRTVTFNEFIKPACLPPPGRSFAGSLGYVTGWGTIYSNGPVSSVLQEVVVPVWQPNECSAAYPNKIFPGMMCAGTKAGGKDSCQGDSGGPYQVQIFPNRRWFIAGIVSWGIGCARPEKPGVYTEVTKYLDWITSNARG